MSNHVSRETAEQLRDAGLVWQPKVGDWFVATLKSRQETKTYVVFRVGGVWPVRGCPVDGGEWFDWDLAECLPLWRADDLLEELARREYAIECDRDRDGRWHVRAWIPEATEWYSHEQQAEAAGHALLAILRGEGERSCM